MRILQVLTDDDRRGAQVFGVELGARLAELGHEVRTVALAIGDSGGLDVPVLGKAPLGYSTLRELRRAMAGTDVTVAHGSTTLPACALAGVGPTRPVVYRQISDPAYWTPTRLSRTRVRLYYRFVRRVVALSTTTLEVLHERFGVARDRITVVPNGVDERRCPPALPGARKRARNDFDVGPGPTLAYVGALAEEKGVADLLAAADPSWTILVAGDGPLRVELESASWSGDVRFLGSVDDPWSVYAAADLVVLPSRGGDTQPAVLIEAALVGTPCISTPIGAIPEIIQPGVNGELVEPGDVAALRGMIERLLGDDVLRARLATKAQADAKARFAMNVVAEKWDAVLRGVVPVSRFG